MQIDENQMVHTFIERTMANLSVVSNQNRLKTEIYEVTQAINSFTGILIYPISKIPKESERRKLDEFLRGYISIKINNTKAPLVNKLRNAIAHGNFRFFPNPEDPFEIGSITFWDHCQCGHKEFVADISVNKLFTMIKALCEKLKEFKFPASAAHSH
jgi:hypothetical protein